jgi:D-alanine-D-alanine ligase
VSDLNELENAINNAFSYAEKIIVEPAVVNLKEVNCSVLGDTDGAEASECESPVTTADGFLSYEDKYMDSGSGSKTGGFQKLCAARRFHRNLPPENE